MYITQQWHFASMAVKASSTSISSCRAPHSYPLRPSPHSWQQSSPWVCSPNPQVPAPSPCAYRRTHVSGWDAHGCGMHCLCGSHSVLPATDRLLHSPPGLRSSTSVPADLPTSEGAFPVQEPLLFFSFSLQGHRSRPACSPLPFPFFYPYRTWLHRDLSCPCRHPRSSASVQHVLCENSSICRCILAAFVGRSELHILLLLHHFVSPSILLFLDEVVYRCQLSPVDWWCS